MRLKRTMRIIGWGSLFVAVVTMQQLVFRATLAANRAADAVAHTQGVRAELESARSALAEAQTHQREYLLTGDDADHERYRASAASVRYGVDQLRGLTALDADQHDSERLGQMTSAALDEMAHTIDLRRRDDFAIGPEALSGAGETHAVESLRGLLEEMAGEQSRRLSDRQRQEARSRGLMIASFVGLSVRNLLVVGLSILFVRRHLAERRKAQRRIRHQSLHDPLTRLPNRVLFHRRLARCVRRARAAGQAAPGCAVLFVDMDHFKAVNDTLGHAAGDRLLRSIAARLLATVRSAAPDDTAPKSARRQDTVARMGGDEFTVLLDGLESPDQAIAVAERLLAVLSAPHHYRGKTMLATPSIGIALGGPECRRAEDLIRNADAAMYVAKLAGKACWRVFDPATPPPATHRIGADLQASRAPAPLQRNVA